MTSSAFDRVFDRYPAASIAYDNAPAIGYSIGFYRLFDRLCSIPSYSYGDRSARRGLGRWRHDPPKGRGRKDLVTPNTQVTFTPAACRLGISPWRAEESNALLAGTSGVNFTRSRAPCASHASGMQARTPHKPLWHNEQRGRRHLFDDHRKGIYARGLPHSKSFLGRNGERARKRSAGHALGEAEALRISNPDFSIALAPQTPTRCRRTRFSSRRSYSRSSLRRAALSGKPVVFPPQRPGVLFRRGSAQKFRTAGHD
jgi:hypothetical protein